MDDRHERFSEYRTMWIMTFFDLPTETKKDKKAHARFRKDLKKDGFTMMQYSVYIRHCGSQESADAHVRRLENYLPGRGRISVLKITDRQFATIKNFWGTQPIQNIEAPPQLEMF